jgi:hypothetical protein
MWGPWCSENVPPELIERTGPSVQVLSHIDYCVLTL